MKKELSEKMYRNRSCKDQMNRALVSWNLSIHRGYCHKLEGWETWVRLDLVGRQGEVCRAGVVETLRKVCGLGVTMKARTGGQDSYQLEGRERYGAAVSLKKWKLDRARMNWVNIMYIC